MIPKIIHLCWLSGDPYPKEIQACIDSWKKYLPDYEIMLWDTNRFDVNSTTWTKEAFSKRKYAFVADYIRLYAVYNYGGIYLDSDILVYKSFNELLDLPYFIGQEYQGSLEPAAFGAEKGLLWIGEILEQYKDKHFILPDGSYDMQPLPEIFGKVLFKKYKFYSLESIRQFSWDGEKIYVFNRHFFNSRNSIEVQRTEYSFCAHKYSTSWRNDTGVKVIMYKFIPVWIRRAYFHIKRGSFRHIDISPYTPSFEDSQNK